MVGELQPPMRAGDEDRQAVVEQPGKHFGEGRLTVEESDERVVRAHGATYLDQLPVAVLLLVTLLFWALVVAVLEGAPILLMALLLFLFLRHKRWSHRW